MKHKTNHIIVSLLVLCLLLTAGCAVPPTATLPPATEKPPAAEKPPVKEEPELPVPGTAGHIVLATTTSTDDSGLLGFLLPIFEAENSIKVDVIAVGSGQAMQIGQDGNADILLVHSPASEAKFLEAGHGVRREDVMYNDFILLGPEADPAGIKGMTSAVDAFKKLAETKSVFLSRGDESGTHVKEKTIWSKAEIQPTGDWYLSTGLGMGDLLTMADEMQGYTLSDRATYLARAKKGLGLVILVEGDPVLFNPYGVISVNPAKNPNINFDMANRFIDWIISVPTQKLISEFGVADWGQPLFTPSSQEWKESQGGGN